MPILRTIVNDGVIALGIYSFSGREVSAATVAAFLTIIGYSIYDTIIIFDRVRENLPLMRRSTVKEIINTSLWETVRRSLATTIITLLPVAALYLFGGAVLQDFAFMIPIGIGISAFSTIFIAAPFLAVLLSTRRNTRVESPGPGRGRGPRAGWWQPARRPAGSRRSRGAGRADGRRSRGEGRAATVPDPRSGSSLPHPQRRSVSDGGSAAGRGRMAAR